MLPILGHSIARTLQLAYDSCHAVHLLREPHRHIALTGVCHGAAEPRDAVLVFNADLIIAQLTAFLEVAADLLRHRFLRGSFCGCVGRR
jgi:hypothetical protein